MRIVITSDGSELARRAFAAALPLAKTLGAEVTLLRILDPGAVRETISAEVGPDPGGMDERARRAGAPISPARRVVEDRGAALESARAAADEQLRDEAARDLPGIASEVRVEWADHAAEAIVRVVRELGADLLVMSTHGRSGLGQALLGSTTAAVVRHSPVPVMVVGSGVEPAP